MPARISIVIPTLNAADTLPGCLAGLIEGLDAGTEGGLIRELIISDGGSQDATLAIAGAAGADLVHGPASRGGQLRRGCAAANGQWLLILHGDTVLAPGWAAVVARHVEQPGGGPAWFRLAFDETSLMARLVAGWANTRAALFGLPYGDQGLLLPRADYLRAGGYLDQPLMEDVALARALDRLTGLPVLATTSAARYRRDGWLRRGARNLWTLLRYFGGVDPAILAARYRK